ncbi:MAG: hypothetical protein AVDCRST_MAG68-1799, partial [uncultured Gemmatimonadetes bacterium]
ACGRECGPTHSRSGASNHRTGHPEPCRGAILRAHPVRAARGRALAGRLGGRGKSRPYEEL